MDNHACKHEWEIATLKSDIKYLRELTAKDFQNMKEDLKNATWDIKEIKGMIYDFIEYAKENYVSKKEYETKCQTFDEKQLQFEKYMNSQNLKLAWIWWATAVIIFLIQNWGMIISLFNK